MFIGIDRQHNYAKEDETKIELGRQMFDYIKHIKEGGQNQKSRERYEARVCAKVRSGQKLTPSEMSFLARTNPALYAKALRAQRMSKDLETKLKACNSKQEAEDVFYIAVQSISQKDPDRDMLIKALSQVYQEFKQSPAYQQLPDQEEEAQGRKNTENIEYGINSRGYQESYRQAEERLSFSANS